MENTRVIKPDGWAISTASSPEEINSALALFDYLYSEEGNQAQNYGPPIGLEEGGIFVAPDGTVIAEGRSMEVAKKLENGGWGYLIDCPNGPPAVT